MSTTPRLVAVETNSHLLADVAGRRNRAIVAARDAGCTWRSIAAAAGMSELGVRKIYNRTKTTKGDRP